MLPRFMLICFGACLSSVALAQTPTITITPKLANSAQQTILNIETCADTTTRSFFDVVIDFGLSVPLAGTTVDIQLGETCPGSSCEDILLDEALTQAETTLSVDLSSQRFLDAAGVAVCEGDGAGVDKKLTLFVTVTDSLNTTTKGDNKNIFIDTIVPAPAEELSAEGGEGVLHVTWESVEANQNTVFVLNPQEATFIVQCRLSGSADEFEDCGALTATNTGPFTTSVTSLDGEDLENGVEIEFRVITFDTAGNESLASISGFGAPQDVLDFGENYNGSELGGCNVGHSEAPLLWAFLLSLVVVLLRRSQRLL